MMRYAAHCSKARAISWKLLTNLRPSFTTYSFLVSENSCVISFEVAPASLVEEVNLNMLDEPSKNRSCARKRNQGKLPRSIHKAEREKMKREHINELFLDLANALELGEQNNGKAAILCEATRLLKDLLGQIESLKKENASLLSEAHYVMLEKNELKDENSAIETHIEELEGEIEARLVQYKPDLNIAPPSMELESPEQVTNFPGDTVQLPTIDPRLQQGPAVLVVPLRGQLQAAFSAPNAAELRLKPCSNINKPHARYPTPADSWPSQLLGEQTNLT